MLDYVKQIIKKNDVDKIYNLRKKHLGSLNPKKTIYYINEANEDLGFFAMFRYWLEYLYFADVCGYTPVIEVGSDFAYSDGVYSANAFEDYFVQPRISLQEAKKSSNVIFSSIDHRNMVSLILTGRFSHYYFNKRYLYLMSKVVQKYIKFNDRTTRYINSGIESLGLTKFKVLGVHVRGTDFRKQYTNHPVYLHEEEVFEEIDKIIKNYDKLFLATDDNRVLKSFKDKYEKEVLCYYSDVMRGDKNTSVIFIKNEKERINNNYLLGLEVIRDMYTLSMCHGLVGGISQVAVCSQIYKMSSGCKYEDLVIIDKGINQNGRGFKR